MDVVEVMDVGYVGQASSAGICSSIETGPHMHSLHIEVIATIFLLNIYRCGSWGAAGGLHFGSLELNSFSSFLFLGFRLACSFQRVGEQ